MLGDAVIFIVDLLSVSDIIFITASDYNYLLISIIMSLGFIHIHFNDIDFLKF